MAELKPVFLNPLHETRISSDFPTNEKLASGSVLSCWGGSSPWCTKPSKRSKHPHSALSSTCGLSFNKSYFHSPKYRNEELPVPALGCLNNKCYVNVGAGAAPEARELFGSHDPDFVQMCRGEVRYKYRLYKLL